MSEWKEGILSDVAEIIMGQSPTGETCNTNGVGVPLLNGPTEFGIKYPEPLQFTSEPKKFSKKNDILFCVRGSTTGKMNWADQEYALGRGLAAIRPKNGEECRYFIRGVIDFNLSLLLASATGSTFPNVSRDQLYGLEIFVPPLEEQKAIASVLSSLDDKIDLLHRQNRTLEAMAETLFRQWFVEEAQDWKDGILGDVLELIYGKALKEDLRTGSGYPVVGSSGIVGHHAEYLVEGPGIVIGRKGTLGKVTYLFENFFPIDTTYYIKSQVNSAGMLYEYFLLKTLSFENSDSAVPGLNRDIALSEEIKIPPQNLIEEFNDICAGFFSKMKVNINQIRTLETLRDSLLPKLMSGEVRVTV